MRYLKDLRVILALVLVITLIGAGLGFYFVTKGHKTVIAEKDATIQNLNAQISNVEVTVPVAILATDVVRGKIVEEADITYVEIPESAAGLCLRDFSEIQPSVQGETIYYKSDLSAGSFLTKDCFYSEVLTSDLRYYDVVTHQNPIGLEADTYVDIRIQLPMGDDYVGLSHKRIIQLNSGVLKLILNEEEIHIYNSMLVDSMLYPGTQIYAVEYVEGGIQDAAIAFYPISSTIYSVAESDPNLLSAIQQDIQLRRQAMEGKLDSANMGLSEKDAENLNKILSGGRESILKVLSASQKQVDKEKAEYAKQQAKEAAKAAKQ